MNCHSFDTVAFGRESRVSVLLQCIPNSIGPLVATTMAVYICQISWVGIAMAIHDESCFRIADVPPTYIV